MANKYKILTNLLKGDYTLIRVRAISSTNVAGEWKTKYCIAGDTTIPTSPISFEISVIQILGSFRFDISSSYLANKDADIKYLRWYVNDKDNEADDPFTSDWLYNARLTPESTFIFTPDTSQNKFYDIWCIAEDISGNYNTSPTIPQISNIQASKIINIDITDRTIIGYKKIMENSITTNELNFTVAGSDNIVAMINASTEGIDIVGSKILLDGNVTIDGTFTLNGSAMVNGSITGTKIAGTTITAANIAVGTITATEMTIATLSAITANMGTITGGSVTLGTGDNVLKFDATNGLWLGNATFGSAPFRISLTGALTATSATISGTITATSGAVAGWTIAATTLTSATGIIVLDSSNEKIDIIGTDLAATMDITGTYGRIYIHSGNYNISQISGTVSGNNKWGNIRVERYDNTTLTYIVQISAQEGQILFGNSKLSYVAIISLTGLNLLELTGNWKTSGYVDAVTGYKDNGVAGVDGTFVDNNGNTIQVSGGIITDLTV